MPFAIPFVVPINEKRQMATSVSGEFETALKRLEEIVAKLEGDNVTLDDSVALFKEGKGLAQKCERLLKTAQESIEAAARGEQQAPAASGASSPAVGTLFGNSSGDGRAL
jgi:exodeoxyribonuclease VII small subunit